MEIQRGASINVWETIREVGKENENDYKNSISITQARLVLCMYSLVFPNNM